MCGIAGQVGTSVRKLNYPILTAMGVHNDTRGGDSCGVYIDGFVEYGFDKTAKFTSFYKDSALLNNTDSCQIAFIHDRKASVGGVKLSAAQPVVIKENDKVLYVLMHNGTITNYEELAKKYIPDISIEGLTDSQVMAAIFYHKGYEALGEYEGAAVFAIADYRTETPTVLLWKGESKEYSYTAETSEERPLYYTVEDGTLYFSSISTELFFLSKDVKVWYLPTNTLLRFEGTDELVAVQKYDRSSKWRKTNKVVCAGYATNYSGTYYRTTGTSAPTYGAHSRIWEQDGCYRANGQLLDNKVPFDVDGKYAHDKELWFFGGVHVASEDVYQFLSKIAKRRKCTNAEFVKQSPNFVRFYSTQPIYIDTHSQLARKAIAPDRYVLYTGDLQVPLAWGIHSYTNGVKTLYTSQSPKNFDV